MTTVRRGLESAVAFVSGKGGVGKTNLVANVAVAAAEARARVLVVDGDLSLANLDVLLALVPGRNAGDLLAGDASFEDVVIEGPAGVHLLPATSGHPELAALDAGELEPLQRAIHAGAADYDLVLVDAGAGVGPTVLNVACSCGRVVLVATPEPTSLADAYATLKVLGRRGRDRVDVVVNEARDERAARATFDHLSRLAERFLETRLGWLGFVPRDRRLADAVSRQRPVVELYPGAPASRRVRELANRLLGQPRFSGSDARAPARTARELDP